MDGLVIRKVSKTDVFSVEFFLNGVESSLNSVISLKFSEFRESDKSLKHELGSI